MDRNKIGLVVALIGLLVVLVGVAYADSQERICISCGDHSEFIWGADLYFYSDEASTQKLHIDGLTGNIDSEGTVNSAGATTLQSTLNVQGATDLDTTLNVDGAVNLNSTLDVDGNISSGTGAVTVTDNVVIDGAADIIQLRVQGYTTQTTDIMVVEDYTGTDVFNVDSSGYVTVTAELTVPDVTVTDDIAVTDDLSVSGEANLAIVHYDVDVSKRTTNTAVTDAESGTLYTNMGATTEITFTLPGAVVGTNYCIYVADAYTITVSPDVSDTIHHLTNATGDRLQNTGTAGDSVCLIAVDSDYWVPLQEIGTWADAN